MDRPVDLSEEPNTESRMVLSHPGFPKRPKGRRFHLTQLRCAEKLVAEHRPSACAPWDSTCGWHMAAPSVSRDKAISRLLSEPQLSSCHPCCQLAQSSVLIHLFCTLSRKVVLIRLNMVAKLLMGKVTPAHFLSRAVALHPSHCPYFMFPLSSSRFYVAFSLDFPSMLRTNDMLTCSIGVRGCFERARMCEGCFRVVESIHGSVALFSKHVKETYAEIINPWFRGTLWQVHFQNWYFPLVDCIAEIIFMHFCVLNFIETVRQAFSDYG